MRVNRLLTFWMLFWVTSSIHTQINTHFYHSEHFGVQEGLHHGVILDQFVDQQGLVWIHTLGQIQIFDGRNFIEVDHRIPEVGFVGRFSSTDTDHLFFVTSTALYRFTPSLYDRQKPDVLPLPASTYNDKSTFFLYESRSFLFVWHRNDSVYQIRKEDMTMTGRYVLPQPFLSWQVTLKADPADAVPNVIEYLGKDHNLYAFHPADGTLDTLYTLNHPRSSLKIGRDTFVSLNDEYLMVHTPGENYKVLLPDTTQDFFGEYLLEVSRNKVLVALGFSVYSFNLDTRSWVSRFQKTTEGHFYDVKLRTMNTDAAGNIYFSSFTSGLTKLYPRNNGFHYVGTRDPDKRFVVRLLVSDSNNLVLMASLQDGLLVYDTSGNLLRQVLDFPGGIRHRYIKGLVKLSENRYVILTDSRCYALSVDHRREIHLRLITTYDTEWLNFYSTVLKGYGEGVHYVTGWYGLMTLYAGEEIKLTYQDGHPFAARIAATAFRSGYLASGRDTMIWMDASLTSVLGRYPLPRLGFHRCIQVEDVEHILLGTDLGLYRIRIGDQARIMDTLTQQMVYSILPGDSPGQYWFSTDYGLYRLESNARLMNYSIESGLQDNEFNTNACYRSEHGKLFFGGINGITSFYPSEVSVDADRIQAYVSSMTVNHEIVGRYISAPNGKPWVFSHSESTIGVELLGKGRRSPSSYNYQYMIPQLHPHWINMGRDARIQFQLSPGSYTMYYHIGNTFDPNARPDQYIKWVIRPPFYKSAWFVGLLTSAAAALLFFFIRLYRKRRELKLRYEFQLEQRIQNERVRISRELHDNIGAQMATVKRNLNFLVQHRNRLSEDQMMLKMHQLEGISTQINQELRDTIWATQQASISIGDFISRLKAYVFQVLGAESDLRVSYEERCATEIVMGPFVALNLHRMCQEAINNIIKHAAATEMRIVFAGDGHPLTIMIADNGRGFDANVASEGYGLNNMRKRAEQIGAVLYFNRHEGPGSQLDIIIHHMTTQESHLL